MIISTAKALDASKVLGVSLEKLDKRAVVKAFHAKAKTCHPDHHGTDKLHEWARVSWAREALLIWVARHPAEPESQTEITNRGDCRACAGTGRVNVTQRGFGKPLTMACVICKGLGTVLQEEDDHD